MKKRTCLWIAAALLASMSLAACNTSAPALSTTAPPPAGEEYSIPWEESSSPPSTTKAAPGSSAPQSTKQPSSSGGAQRGTHDIPEAPSIPVKGEGVSGAEEAFTSLSQLKTLARGHLSAASGYELMAQKKQILLPTGAFYDKKPGDKDYTGSFNSRQIAYGFSFHLPERPKVESSVRYIVLQTSFPSRDIRDCIADSTLNRCHIANINGTSYYYTQDSVDGEDTVTVYSFYGDYCVTAVFYNPPLNENGKFSLQALESRGFFQYQFVNL